MHPLPIVSIITPSYNQANYLEETIRSVLEQDYPNIEYIIIDGGSTDGSQEIIKKYADRLAYWISEPDQGQTDAINKGFYKARGDVLAWINSDDTYLQSAIYQAVEYLQNHPDIDIFQEFPELLWLFLNSNRHEELKCLQLNCRPLFPGCEL